MMIPQQKNVQRKKENWNKMVAMHSIVQVAKHA